MPDRSSSASAGSRSGRDTSSAATLRQRPSMSRHSVGIPRTGFGHRRRRRYEHEPVVPSRIARRTGAVLGLLRRDNREVRACRPCPRPAESCPLRRRPSRSPVVRSPASVPGPLGRDQRSTDAGLQPPQLRRGRAGRHALPRLVRASLSQSRAMQRQPRRSARRNARAQIQQPLRGTRSCRKANSCLRRLDALPAGSPHDHWRRHLRFLVRDDGLPVEGPRLNLPVREDTMDASVERPKHEFRGKTGNPIAD
jgi:hypothetical protein